MILGRQFQAQAAQLKAKLLAYRLDHLAELMGVDWENAPVIKGLEPHLQEITLP